MNGQGEDQAIQSLVVDHSGGGDETEAGAEQRNSHRSSQNIHTRSDLSDQMDAHAIAHVTQMVGQGWTPTDAAEAFIDYVEILAKASGDLAVAEVAWRAS